MLKESISKKNSNWVVKWHASTYLNNRHTLCPPHSLVKNKGNDGSRTHDSNNFRYNTRLKTKPIRIDNLKIAELPESRKVFENFLNSKQKILYKFKRLLNVLLD
jgi:hypothetical protein